MKRSSVFSTLILSIFLNLLLSAQDTTVRVSVSDEGTEADGISLQPAVSANGRWIVFTSHATNLVPGDTNGVTDIFIHDRLMGTTRRVSVSSRGEQADGHSAHPSISADGRWVAFPSVASNLVPGDTNGRQDVFVHDLQTGVTERVSVDDNGDQADEFSPFGGDSWIAPAINADGSIVVFFSKALDLVPEPISISGEGMIRDRLAGTTRRIPIERTFPDVVNAIVPWGVSGDGRLVTVHAWLSSETRAVSFVFDRETGVSERVGLVDLPDPSYMSIAVPRISGDGRWVIYNTPAPLVPNDTNGTYDAYIEDRVTGAIELVSLGADGFSGDESSSPRSISADGRFVAFDSVASNLVPGSNPLKQRNVFLRDRERGVTVLATEGYWGTGVGTGGNWGGVSDNGRVVSFQSSSRGHVPEDTNIYSDVFVRLRKTGPQNLAELIEAVPEAVEEGLLVPMLAASLFGKLEAALEAKTNVAHDGMITAFINELKAQAGKGIDSDLAAEWIELARRLIESRETGGGGPGSGS